MKNKKPKNCLLMLTELEKAISESNIESFKKSSNLLVLNKVTLRNWYDNARNLIRSSNLIILACKHNTVNILEYLFDSNGSILNILSSTTMLPDDEDESRHNAFYYAVRSGNINLLDTLINKWPDNYFAKHLEELDKILSSAYEDLKLKNVPLSDEMEFFVENKLIDLRFFSNVSGRQGKTVRPDINNTIERIELILQNIAFLKKNYSNMEKVDQQFLFVAKSIAQNMHSLKRQLKSTYIRLPWEEIEFCLVSFISSHTKQQEINLFYRATLTKNKLLNHLDNFSNQLEDEKDTIKGMNCHEVDELIYLPNDSRVKVVAKIIRSYPQFEELYKDYRQIRDIHSLQKINVYVKLASSADPKNREGQLIITRVLQIIGEHLKNTLESPKLSDTTSELLLLSLQRNARKIIVDLRNSLSHSYSLSKRMQMEENLDSNFFVNVQNDAKKVGDVISDIFYNSKFKTVRILLQKIVDSKNSDEIIEVTEVLSTLGMDALMQCWMGTSENLKITANEKIENLVKELNNMITDKTNCEKRLFDKINSIINSAGTSSETMKMDYITAFVTLKDVCVSLTDNKTDHNTIREIKYFANQTLQNITRKVKPYNLKEIASLSIKIANSAELRMQQDKLDQLRRVVIEIFYITEFGSGDLKWIEDLNEKLNETGSYIPTPKQKKTKEKYNHQLAVKLEELKGILSNHLLSGPLIEKTSSYKTDKKLQAVVEMLVLDIMSILGSSKLENNLLFLDDHAPLLTGKSLRNHLAHDNILVDVLLSDPSIAVIFNAKKLTEENLTTSKRKIGKLIWDDAFKLRAKFDQGLVIITNQERMFVALEEGNLESLTDCLKNGTDIYAKSISSWTTLHFAAKGPSLEIVKFIINQNISADVKDIKGQTPMHVAAANGRQNIVEFLVEQTHLNVDVLNNSGQTALHVAAQNGHKSTVEVLLRNKANCTTHDMDGLSPLHYAIKNNHIDVVKILLKKDANVDINEIKGGFTSLHAAAERGHLELVNFLLQNKASVNARNDINVVPLHAAASNGHLEVVNVLLLKGADINAQGIDGITPLHYAVENGHEKIAYILVKHGANVNAVDKTYKITPLHYVAKYGHVEIVKILLKNGADARVATIKGVTPLHFAVRGNHLEIVTVLLKHGVDIHSKDHNNATPLHTAIISSNREIIAILIKNKAEINAKSKNNLTPLHIAAELGHKGVVQLLIENKANVNVQDNVGGTPLHAAARNGNKEIIHLLLINNAEVNTRGSNGITPLHSAAGNGHVDAIDFLIKNKAEVNATANYGISPLHMAIMEGHKDAVNLLIQNKAQVDIAENILLVTAIEAGHKEIVEILLANGANVNVKSYNQTPLHLAIQCNHKEIVEVFIKNGANVSDEALLLAILAGYTEIVEIFLKNGAYVNMKDFENFTPLHWAATKGHKKIAKMLISRGANVNATTFNNVTPLHIAAHQGYEEYAEILIAGGANVNDKSNENLTPIHMAVSSGNNNFVKILLVNKAQIDIKDNKNRTAIELAVANGHLQIVKMLLQYKKVDMNAKGNDDWTLLHITSQGVEEKSNLDVVKYLVDEGADINAKNAAGSKAIHIAAREGHRDTVEFFLGKGLNINDRDAANQTLLHYAAMKGHLEVVKYLIAQGASVNTKDINGLTPMHIAANFGYKGVIEVLLQNGAIYNAIDKFNRKPLKVTTNKDVMDLLASTEKLFDAVKRNSCLEVEKYIKAGAFVNVKNADGETPLHYAAWKGYDEVVDVLLKNKTNPNVVRNQGLTPLHYAAKFSHLNIVKALLSNNAVYNAASDGGKTPLDFAVDEEIIDLFNLVSKSFKSVKNGNVQIVKDLNKIKDIDTVKAIMCARNREHKTLVVAAIHSNFSKVEQLKDISQGDLSSQIHLALSFCDQGNYINYQRALRILKSALKKREEVLGPDNPGTLDIQIHIGKVLYEQGVYQEGLNILLESFEKQKEILGLYDKNTLSTNGFIALELYRQGKYEEVLKIYRELDQKQKEILGPHHSDTLDTQFCMALVLDKQGKFEEALSLNRAVFKKRKEIFGANYPTVVYAQNNIAMVLANQGNYEEALKIYDEVYEKKKIIFGSKHVDTLRTLQHIAGVLYHQKKYHEALKAYQKVYNIQENVLGPSNPETLCTHSNIGSILFSQGKWIGALKAYRKCFYQMKAVFGPDHPNVLDILVKMEAMNLAFKYQGSELSEILQHLQNDVNIAASSGDIDTLRSLLEGGADTNDKDIDGRTPLHFAVDNERVDIVNILLKNGADVTQVTNKGNTPLHTAISKGSTEIVDILLQHVSHDKLNDFLNAKTVTSGSTSLHVAAKNGSLDITKSLLKRGAIYDITNKESKTPLDLSKEKNVNNLLKLTEELFEDAKIGNVDRLIAVKRDEVAAVTNARNNEGNTLLQVAIANKRKNVVKKLLEMLKNPDQNAI